MRSLVLCFLLIVAANASIFNVASNKKPQETIRNDAIPVGDDAEGHIPPGADEGGLVGRSKRYMGCGCCGGCCGCGCNCATMDPAATMAPCGCYGCGYCG